MQFTEGVIPFLTCYEFAFHMCNAELEKMKFSGRLEASLYQISLNSSL